MAPFVNTTLQYLDEVAANGAPHLEISWTTRFNAFVPKAHTDHSNPNYP
jgi:hypothetical protein